MAHNGRLCLKLSWVGAEGGHCSQDRRANERRVSEQLRNIDATWSPRECFASLPLHANLKCTRLFSEQMNPESCEYKAATRSSLEDHSFIQNLCIQCLPVSSVAGHLERQAFISNTPQCSIVQ